MELPALLHRNCFHDQLGNSDLTDGRAGADHDAFGGDTEWGRYVARIQAVADFFQPT